MNLFSVTSKLAAPDFPLIALDARRCVHAKDRWSQCKICVRACPVSALRLDDSITLDEEACVACGLCFHVCPVGALTGDDGATDLLNFVTRLPDASTIELACLRHPAPEKGTNTKAIVVRTGKCLAALSPSVLLRLLIKDELKVVARLDACAECALGRVQPEIASTFAAVGQLFPERATMVVAKPDATANTRVLSDVKSPPVSRRAFLREMTGQTIRTVALALASETEEAATGSTVPAERRRLVNVLKRFAPNEALQNAFTPGFGALRLSVDDQCNACAVCVRACPTGAIHFASTAGGLYRLTHLVASCTDCGACLDVCELDALHRDGVPTIAELLANEPQVLKIS